MVLYKMPLKLYPNPVKHSLYIDNDLIGDGVLRIRNISGSVLFTKEIADRADCIKKLDVSDLESGLYLLEYEGSDFVICKEFIKSKQDIMLTF